MARRQAVEALPKPPGGLEAVVHSRLRRAGGFAPLNTVSISTNRPASASAMPSLSDSGIQESSFSTTNLVTSARSCGGRALICSMISCALRFLIMHRNSLRASRVSARSAGDSPDAPPERATWRPISIGWRFATKGRAIGGQRSVSAGSRRRPLQRWLQIRFAPPLRSVTLGPV